MGGGVEGETSGPLARLVGASAVSGLRRRNKNKNPVERTMLDVHGCAGACAPRRASGRAKARARARPGPRGAAPDGLLSEKFNQAIRSSAGPSTDLLPKGCGPDANPLATTGSGFDGAASGGRINTTGLPASDTLLHCPPAPQGKSCCTM